MTLLHHIVQDLEYTYYKKLHKISLYTREMTMG